MRIHKWEINALLNGTKDKEKKLVLFIESQGQPEPITYKAFLNSTNKYMPNCGSIIEITIKASIINVSWSDVFNNQKIMHVQKRQRAVPMSATDHKAQSASYKQLTHINT